MASPSRWKRRVASIEANPGFASLTQATLASLIQSAAAFLDLASGFKHPPEIFPLLTRQMAALPPNRQQEGIATIKDLSAAMNYLLKQT